MFKVLNNIINRKLLYYLGYIIFILKNTFASDFFVDQEFSSDSLTFNTIQEAVNYAQPGDNIIVREGRYSEWVRIMGKRATDTAPTVSYTHLRAHETLRYRGLPLVG